MTEKKQTILIVDDERTNIQILVDIFKLDYKIAVAKSGKQAIQACNGTNPPDLVLLDVVMPGMDGYETCERLKADKATCDIPVIFVSAMDQLDDETKGLKLGAIDYITKPVSGPIVRQRIKAHMALKESMDIQKRQNEKLQGLNELKNRWLGMTAHDTWSSSFAVEENPALDIDRGKPPESREKSANPLERQLSFSPLRILFIVAASIFSIEAIIMHFLGIHEISSHLLEMIIDSSLLVLCVLPLLYFFLFRPLITKEKTFKAMVASLNESETKYKSLVEGSPDLIYIFSSKSGGIYYSPRVEEILGYSSSQLIENPLLWHNSIHPEDIVEVENAMGNFFKGKRYEIEYRIKNSKGEFLWFRDRFVGNEISGDEIIIQGLATDITERKKIEQALRQSEQRLFLHVEQTPLGVIEWGIDFKVTKWNPAAEKIFGYSKDDAIGRHPTEIIMSAEAKDQVDMAWKVLLHKKDGGRSTSDSLTKDGRTITCEWYNTPLIDDEGSIIGVASLVLDITERKRAEKALKESFDFQNKIFSESPVGMAVYDAVGQCVLANSSFSNIIGGTKEQALKQNYNDIESWEKSGLLNKAKSAMSENSVKRHDLNDKSTFGKNISLDCHLVPVFLESKSHLLLMTNDIANHVEMEDALRIAKEAAESSSKAKSVFLSSMSHEIRAPLNSILGYSQIMEADTQEPLSGSQKSMMRAILKSGDHLLDLIDEILDLSKIESGKLDVEIEDVDVGAVSRRAVEMVSQLAEENKVKIVSQVPGNVFVKADSKRLYQVLLNFLSNAVKYNTKGGEVAMACEPVGDSVVRITVSDTGPGIPEEYLGLLFNPFDRLGKEELKIKGTGIGLTIVKRLVELMGGEVGVESEVGKGSSFYVDLKAGQKVASRKAEEVKKPVDVKQQQKVSERRYTLLYVDDDKDNLQLLTKVINMFCPEVKMLTADEAQTGIELAKTHRPDIILMDISMPGMNGIKALQLLLVLDETRNIPVVAVSGRAMEHEIEKGMAAGFTDYITKPINVEHLLQVIDEILVL